MQSSVIVQMNTWTQILMRFSHPKQIPCKDLSKYVDKRMKNGCLPGIAFSNCKIFTLVFLECCGPFVLTRKLTHRWIFQKWSDLSPSQRARGLWKSGAALPGCWDLGGGRRGMMQVGESVFEMFLSVWCSWHSELCRWSAIKLFEHVGWLKASGCLKLLKCKTDIGKFRILCETCKRNTMCGFFLNAPSNIAPLK